MPFADEKVNRSLACLLARQMWFQYRHEMTRFARSLVVLLIAVAMVAVLAVPGGFAKAEPSVDMALMKMGSEGQDCPNCDTESEMAAVCDLICSLSVVGILADPAMPAIARPSCRFDPADATASGRVPPPAFTPPRTILLT